MSQIEQFLQTLIESPFAIYMVAILLILFVWWVFRRKSGGTEQLDMKLAELGNIFDHIQHNTELQYQVQELMVEKSKLQTQLENVRQQLNERGQLEERFKDAFSVLSSNVLKSQGEDFHSRYEGLFKLGQQEIDKIVRPLKDNIERLDREGVAQATSFKEQITKMIEESNRIGKEAQDLKNALRKPSVRGRWGETQLELALELSGLCEGVDYTTQDTSVFEGQRMRTDVIVNMSKDRSIILDSKISLNHLMDSFDTDDEEQKAQALKSHVKQVKKHVEDLANKEYWQSQSNTPDFVVMVLPEFAFLPAIEQDNDLIEWALKKKVIVVTTPALLALLKAIALTWKQVRIEKTTREIADLGKNLHDRLAVFVEHYIKVGESLEKSFKHYGDATGSWNRRIMPQINRFKELEIHVTKDMKPVPEVEATSPRIIKTPEKNSKSD